jgi:Icc-related predicted phosphoesterase
VTCIAAVGDIHVGTEDGERVAAAFDGLDERCQALLLAGDLTRCGDPGEAKVLARVLEGLSVPVVAVLGNHDYHADQVDEIVTVLVDAGVQVLEGTATTLVVDGMTVGIAGTKGFGGGFVGASVSEFGEPLMKAFARCTAELAERLEDGLWSLAATDHRIALLHYAPVPDTLRGEKPQLYPVLGSYLLGEAVDRAGADLVLHGHAHMGTERGLTPGGIRVRNVALPVIGTAYRVFDFAPHERLALSS